MKKKIGLWVFLAVAVMAVALRFFEVSAYIDSKTGFILPEYKTAAVVISAVILALIAVSTLFTCISAIGGKKEKGFYPLTSVFSALLGAAAAFQIFDSFSGIPQFLRIICVVFAVLSAVYFIAFSVRFAVHFPFSARYSAIPAAFFVFKAACVAIKSAYHTVISDTVFEIASYCFIMLFFLEFARLANGTALKASIKKFATFGTAAALLSLTFSVPKFLVCIIEPAMSAKIGFNDILLAFAGLYIACEVFTRLSFTQEKNQKAVIYYIGKH